MRRRFGSGMAAAVLVVAGLIAAGCGGGGSNSSSKSINVAIVDNPQMKDIAQLTPSLFTKQTGIKVNYTVLDEGTLRQVTTRDVAAGGKQFDVAMIGPFEAPQFGQQGTLVDLTPDATSDAAPSVVARGFSPAAVRRLAWYSESSSLGTGRRPLITQSA